MTQFDEINVKTLHVRTTSTHPDGFLRGDHVSSAAADRIPVSKVVHRRILQTDFEPTDATADKTFQYIAGGDGTVNALHYTINSAPTGTDTVTIDLQKAVDGSGAFSTVLTSTITVNSGTTTDTRAAGSINTSSYNQYDRFNLVINDSGGGSGSGLLVSVEFNEEPS